MPVQTSLRLRRGTAAQWTSANPVLSDGEPGVESDTGNIKVGDGTTAWSSLSYALSSRYKPLASDVLFVGAADFAATFGSPTLGGTSSTNNGGTAVWLLDASSTEIMCAYVAIPPGWTTADVYLWWANDGTGSGNVVVAVWRNAITDGATIDAASGGNQTFTAGSRNVAIRSTVTTGLSVTANSILKLAVRRDAANGADTLANDMAVIGVELVRAS